MVLRWLGPLLCVLVVTVQCASPLPPLDGFPCQDDSACGGTLKLQCIQGFCRSSGWEPPAERLPDEKPGAADSEEASREKPREPVAPEKPREPVSREEAPSLPEEIPASREEVPSLPEKRLEAPGDTEPADSLDASEPAEEPVVENVFPETPVDQLPPVCVDKDKDGYCANIPGPKGKLDCDDNDKAVFPGNPETCDNKDNDCNGMIDDNLSQPCTTACGAGTQTCSTGQWSACSSQGQPEICDGKDNDCDGQIDEDLSACVTVWVKASQLKGRNLQDIAVDANGNLYFLDTIGHRILKVDNTGQLTVVAGAGSPGYKDGSLSTAMFNEPQAITVGPGGELYVAEHKSRRIRKIDLVNQVVSTYAGSGLSGTEDGPAMFASLGKVTSLASDIHGNLYMLESDTHRVRVITPQGQVLTLAGSGKAGQNNDKGTLAEFNTPSGLVVDWYGNLYIADRSNHTIRKVDTTGQVTTLAGDGQASFLDATSLLQAQFNDPVALAMDSHGRLIVVDLSNKRIRQIDLTQGVTTLAGGGTTGSVTGPALQVQWNSLMRAVISPQGYLYILDTGNQTPGNQAIYRMDLRGVTTAQACTSLGQSRPCYTGPASTRGKGLCKDGVQTCDSDMHWSRCKNETLPTTEACNGQDDDCNGTTDNTPSLPFCSKQLSVCFGVGRQTCNNGVRVFCSDSRYSSHNASYQNDILDKCDTIDNNCNGSVDENDQSCVVTQAGTGTGGFAAGPRSQVAIGDPGGLALDSAGNVVVSTHTQHRVAWFDRFGNLTRSVGSSSGFQDSTDPTKVQFDQPGGLVVDAQGNTYVADTLNHRIRKISPQGTVTTVAGDGQAGFQDGPGHQAQFRSPSDIALDSKGNLYVSDTLNHRIRKIDSQGNVTTFVGSGTAVSQDGLGSKASLILPLGLAVDLQDNLYVVEDRQIRKITPRGQVSTLSLGPLASTLLNKPWGIAVDLDGTLYVSSVGNHTIVQIDPQNNIAVFAGNQGVGFQDGQASQAKFSSPIHLALDRSRGYLYVADQGNHRVRRINLRKLESCAANQVGDTQTCYAGPSNAAGQGICQAGTQTCDKNGYWGACLGQVFPQPELCNGKDDNCDGQIDESSQMLGPLCSQQSGICAGSRSVTCAGGQWQACTNKDLTEHDSRYFLTDRTCDQVDNDCNGLIDDAASNCVTTLAGTGVSGIIDGPGNQAQFREPQDVVVDSKGNVYVVDLLGSNIRKIDPQGNVTTFASGQFRQPKGLAIDASDNLYVADTGNNAIHKITPQGVVSTIAGQASPGHVNAQGTAAQFRSPHDVAIDSQGNLYVTDLGNRRIRKIDPQGNVTDYAGDGTASSSPRDGDLQTAQFSSPTGLVIDAKDNLYISETAAGPLLDYHRIRKIDTASATPTVSTVAGTGVAGKRDSTLLQSQFSNPSGLAVNAQGTILYVADRSNARIRKVDLVNKIVTTLAGDTGVNSVVNGIPSQSRFGTPVGIALDASGNLYVTDARLRNVRKITP